MVIENTQKQKVEKEVWVLIDDKIGHTTQTLGIADALGLPYIKKNIIYTEYAKKPNLLKFNPHKSVDKFKSDKIYDLNYPDIIISCGRKLAPIASSIKKKAKSKSKKVFCCHIMLPELTNLSNLDLVTIPCHEKAAHRKEKNKKFIKTIGSPNRITREFLLQEYRIWSRTIGELPHPRLAVLIGGDTRKGEMTIKHAKKLIDYIVSYTSKNNASVLISTSRRTSDEVADYIEEKLRKKLGRYVYFHNFKKNKANPFYAFLQMSDVIISTADSISMCSEACSVGKPVYVFSPEDILPEKHEYFASLLFQNRFAKSLEGHKEEFLERKESNKIINILNSSFKVADEIRKRAL